MIHSNCRGSIGGGAHSVRFVETKNVQHRKATSDCLEKIQHRKATRDCLNETNVDIREYVEQNPNV